jgi:short subunit dehydrogenase-like uncharacterized protein
VHGWCIPFLGADKAVVYRSMMSNYALNQHNPIQFVPYLRTPSFFSMICMIFAGLIFGIFTKFSFGRYLLEQYPKQMSFGFCSKTGPSRKQIESSSIRMTFVGLGYEGKNATEGQKDPPTKKIVTSLYAPEPGYVTTPICVVQAAYVLLKEKNKMPKGGGVFTPGAAFAKTSLLTRLQNREMKFTVDQQ